MFESITKETVKGKAIRELQGLKTRVVAGDTAATDIAVADLVNGDTIQSVIVQDGTSGVIEGELSSEASIQENNALQLASTDTTGKVLVVNFYSKP